MAEFLDVFDLNFNDSSKTRKPRQFRGRMNPMEEFNDDEFYSRYRFDKPVFVEICDLVRNDLSTETNRNHPVSVEAKVAACLRYYASGSFQEVIGDTIFFSQPSMNRFLTQFSTAMDNHFDNFVYFNPYETEIRRLKTEFSAVAGFPNVIGCIDGTHIPIVAPHDNEYQFVNRKGYHSINVQAMCDRYGKFTNLVAKWPGSAHDSSILKQSLLWEFFEENPNIGFILGDSAYCCRPWLMTSLRSPASQGERKYNSSHKKTRVLIENCFGRWKRRFAVLGIPNRRRLENVLRDIRVCAILHNVATDKKLPDIFEGENDALQDFDDDDELDFEEPQVGPGVVRRNRLVLDVFGRDDSDYSFEF